MRVIVRDDALTASRYIADRIACKCSLLSKRGENYRSNILPIFTIVSDSINSFRPTPSKSLFILGLPTGSSPKFVYDLLVQKYKSGDLSFKNVATFNMVRTCLLVRVGRLS
jgi:glucosamine-6-phosphate deaminase